MVFVEFKKNKSIFVFKHICNLFVLILRFNCGKAEALQTLEDIYHRACYSCYCEVILLANAIKNSCQGYFDG